MTTRFTLRFVLFAFALTGLVSLSSVIAQETPETDAPAASAQEAVEVDPPPSDAKPADESDPEAPATEAPSDEPAPPEKASSADAPSADASPDADKPAADSEVYAKYQERLQEWKSVLLNLRDLDVKYSVAEESELEGLADQWTKEIERGKEMIPALRAAAFEAYRENPTRDRELEQFLVKMLIDEANRDASENAYELGKALIDNGVRTEKTLAAAGIGAYGVNEYDDAERYLKEAVSLATNRSAPSDDDDLLNRAQEYLLQIPSQRELWAEEQKFRAEEAEADDLPRVALETSKGTIVLELFENQAPNTVANFVSLVEKNFYDGLAFHRVLPHFMAQGGDPQGDGTGGPGYAIACEWPNDPNRSHFRGSLSMAHAGRDTGGSQFFLTFLPTPHLNDRHTVFGRVIEGFDVLSELRRIDPSSPVAGKEPDRILKAEVLRKHNHEYKPETLPERG